MKHLNSLNESDSRYREELKPEIEYSYNPKPLYKGGEIDDIECNTISLTYDIEIEARSYGIKGIMVSGISGPPEVAMQITWYNESLQDMEYEDVVVPLDWSTVEVEHLAGEPIRANTCNISIESIDGVLVATKIQVMVGTL